MHQPYRNHGSNFTPPVVPNRLEPSQFGKMPSTRTLKRESVIEVSYEPPFKIPMQVMPRSATFLRPTVPESVETQDFVMDQFEAALSRAKGQTTNLAQRQEYMSSTNVPVSMTPMGLHGHFPGQNQNRPRPSYNPYNAQAKSGSAIQASVNYSGQPQPLPLPVVTNRNASPYRLTNQNASERDRKNTPLDQDKSSENRSHTVWQPQLRQNISVAQPAPSSASVANVDVIPPKKERVEPTQTRIFTAGVAKAIEWSNKKPGNHLILFEVFGVLSKVSPSRTANEPFKFLLFDFGGGSIGIRCYFYAIDREMPPLELGKDVRCVGRFVDRNFQCFSVRQADEGIRRVIPRLQFLSMRCIAKFGDLETRPLKTQL